MPDYLGQFIHETGENLFGSLLDRQAEIVQRLMKSYLVGTLALFEKMKPLTLKPDVWTGQRLQIAAAPVIDILELSGYGKLLAELHHDEQLWAAVSDVWDKLLKGNPGYLPWLAAIMTGGIPRFQIPHRGLVRTNWSIRIEQELRKLPRRDSVHGRINSIFRSDHVEHSSPLVRYCARYRLHEGRNIFAALYLSKQPGTDGLEWGVGVRELLESVGREEKSYRESGDSNEQEE